MNTRILGHAALICVSLVLMTATAFADGTISGVVIDGYTGQPVRGATVVVDGTEITFATGVGGDFRQTVPDGTYSVTVTKDGFDAHRVTNVVVTDGGVADFAVVLLPSQGEEIPIATETTETRLSPCGRSP